MKYFYTVVAWLAVGLGFAGIFLPLLPTTPFLLLAAACFSRSSPRMNEWLHHNRWFGPYLRGYKSGHGLPLHGKVGILVFLWLSLVASAIWGVPQNLGILRVLLLAIGIGVTIHVARMRTAPRDGDSIATKQSSADR